MLKGKIEIVHLLLPFSLWVSPMTATPAFLLRSLLVLVHRTLSKQFLYISFIYVST